MIDDDNPDFEALLFEGASAIDPLIPLISTADDVESVIYRLGNSHRGVAARKLYEARDVIGRKLAYHALMVAWDHDHDHVILAFDKKDGLFGGEHHFAEALGKVAPKVRRKGPLRIWRGVTVKSEAALEQAAAQISWTSKLDVACWFAVRFEEHRGTPCVLRLDIDASDVLARCDTRDEHEILMDPLTAGDAYCVIEDFGDGLPLDEFDRVPPELLGKWREIYAAHGAAIQKSKMAPLEKMP